jgi:ferric iron reductase protein FhuF
MIQTLDMAALEENYDVTSRLEANRLTIAAADLLDNGKAETFLEDVAARLGTNRRFATGSLFGKRYALLAAFVFHMLTHEGRKLDWSPGNVTLQMEGKQLLFYFHSFANIPIKESMRREQREEGVRDLLVNHLRPVFEQVSRLTGVKMATLWGHLSFLMHGYYDWWLQETKSQILRRKIEEDFRYWIKEANPSWFGYPVTAKNPLDVEYTWIEAFYEGDPPVRQRKKCCFAYCKPDGSFCYTCPSMTAEDRARRRQGG